MPTVVTAVLTGLEIAGAGAAVPADPFGWGRPLSSTMVHLPQLEALAVHRRLPDPLILVSAVLGPWVVCALMLARSAGQEP